MPVLTETACAKINVALHVLGRRADGYHELDSIVVFADFGDHLVLSVSDQDRLQVSGPFATLIPTDSSNIVLKAVAGLRGLYESQGTPLPGISVRLEKNLPVAAGIGGGSSDAAAVLRGVRQLVPAALADAALHQLALSLGADVPVCLAQKACRMRGIGENIEFLDGAPAAAIVLVNPRLELSTRAVFTELGLAPGQRHLAGLEPEHPQSWRNDLLPPALALRPEIKGIVAAFPDGLTAGMSGSGATCFGLAVSLEAAEAAAAAITQHHPSWWVKAGRLQ